VIFVEGLIPVEEKTPHVATSQVTTAEMATKPSAEYKGKCGEHKNKNTPQDWGIPPKNRK
jgi:hypothetical protein